MAQQPNLKNKGVLPMSPKFESQPETFQESKPCGCHQSAIQPEAFEYQESDFEEELGRRRPRPPGGLKAGGRPGMRYGARAGMRAGARPGVGPSARAGARPGMRPGLRPRGRAGVRPGVGPRGVGMKPRMGA